ncbi:uncharacterized protein LOC143619568 [Bidens hawaiensis]|uniref:uncharacterized protein LOC143619568 n=1 Tax=Bidens hawaiensis TaxID=980011 RepID=UPI004049AFE2
MFLGISSSLSSDHFKIKLNLNPVSSQLIGNHAKPGSKICCLCGRRPFVISTALIPLHQSNASASDDPIAVLNRVHPPRPDWYEEFYAAAMDASMKSYEAEIAGYKSQLFANLTEKNAKILEVGIGTGPNLKYYGSGATIVGVDPNRKMEKYAKAAAQASGLPETKFKFIHAVAEALPVSDASMDAVVGTLVLCSVNDVNKTL